MLATRKTVRGKRYVVNEIHHAGIQQLPLRTKLGTKRKTANANLTRWNWVLVDFGLILWTNTNQRGKFRNSCGLLLSAASTRNTCALSCRLDRMIITVQHNLWRKTSVSAPQSHVHFFGLNLLTAVAWLNLLVAGPTWLWIRHAGSEARVYWHKTLLASDNLIKRWVKNINQKQSGKKYKQFINGKYIISFFSIDVRSRWLDNVDFQVNQQFLDLTQSFRVYVRWELIKPEPCFNRRKCDFMGCFIRSRL